MAFKEHMDILNKYINGEVSLEELSDFVDDRLFELRTRSPELTKEGEFLAGIELIIEEIKDGFRSVTDLEAYVKSLIETEEPIISWKVILLDGEDTSSAVVTSGAVSKEPNTIVIPNPAFA